MNRIGLVILLTLFSQNMHGQDAAMLLYQAGELPLETLEKVMPHRTPALMQVSCGDYFLVMNEPNLVPPGIRVTFFAKSDAPKPGAYSILKGKYKIVVDEKKIIPTIQMVLREEGARAVYRQEGGIRHLYAKAEDILNVILRLNKKDYDKASSCLPKP